MENENEKGRTLTPDDPEFYSVENMTPEEFAEYMAELEVESPEEEQSGHSENTDSENPPDAEDESDASEPEPEAESIEEAEEETEEAEETEEPESEETVEITNTEQPQPPTAAPSSDTAAADRLSRIETAARGRYGDNWEDKLINQLDEAAAEEQGVSVEEYRSRRRDSEDLRRYRDNDNKRAEQEQRAQEIIEAWNADEVAIKEADPGFDLKKTMREDEAFRNRVLSGISVAAAYITTKKAAAPAEETKPAEAEEKPAKQKPKRREISQNAQSAAQRGTGNTEDNPAQYSSRDFKEYINRIKNS